jgi:hypothetical protein
MTTGRSDYLENALLDHVYGRTTYTAPATTYLALFTVAPTRSGGGTEVAGGGTGYARYALANNGANWPAAAARLKSLGSQAIFPTVATNWGIIVAWGIFDASSGGNLLDFGPMTLAVAAGIGDAPDFQIGDITIQGST